MDSLHHKLDQVVGRHDELQKELSLGSLDATRFAQYSKDYAEITPLVEAIQTLRAAEREAGDLAAMLADPATDTDMRAMPDQDHAELKPRPATRATCEAVTTSTCCPDVRPTWPRCPINAR